MTCRRKLGAMNQSSDCSCDDVFHVIFSGGGVWETDTYIGVKACSALWDSRAGRLQQHGGWFWSSSRRQRIVNTSTVWVKKIPPPRLSEFFSFFHKWLRILMAFFTHLLYVSMYATLQICIQLPPTLMKLCHIKHGYLVHIICAKCPKRAR